MERVAVAIPTWHGGDLLARCVASLQAQDPPPAQIVVVVSNPDGAVVPGGVDVDHPGQALHFAAAANRALRALRGRPVLLLNDDTWLAPGALARLCEAYRSDAPAIYQPCILLDDGSGRMDNLGHRLFFDGFNVARGRGTPPPAAHSCRVGAFSGAAALFHPEVLSRVGLFDEDFEAFGEDLDLSLRAHRRGFDIQAVPQAIVYHRLGASYGRTGPSKVHRVERNRVQAAVRSLPLSALATAPLWSGLRLAATAAAALGAAEWGRVGPPAPSRP